MSRLNEKDRDKLLQRWLNSLVWLERTFTGTRCNLCDSHSDSRWHDKDMCHSCDCPVTLTRKELSDYDLPVF